MATPVFCDDSPTRQNIIAFEKAGWEVYDTKDKIDNRPHKGGKFLTRKNDFKHAWEKNSYNIKGILNKEHNIISRLIDSNNNNDDLNGCMIGNDSFLSVNIKSSDPNIGMKTPNLGIVYLVRKQLSPEQLESFKKISPEYKK